MLITPAIKQMQWKITYKTDEKWIETQITSKKIKV